MIVHASADDAIDIDEGYTGSISNFLIELVEDTDNAIEINGGQGDKWYFTINNGLIDGMGLATAAIYAIGEKAKGKINNVKTVNLAEQTIDNKSTNVSIEASAEEANEMNFYGLDLKKSKSVSIRIKKGHKIVPFFIPLNSLPKNELILDRINKLIV